MFLFFVEDNGILHGWTCLYTDFEDSFRIGASTPQWRHKEFRTPWSRPWDDGRVLRLTLPNLDFIIAHSSFITAQMGSVTPLF